MWCTDPGTALTALVKQGQGSCYLCNVACTTGVIAFSFFATGPPTVPGWLTALSCKAAGCMRLLHPCALLLRVQKADIS